MLTSNEKKLYSSGVLTTLLIFGCYTADATHSWCHTQLMPHTTDATQAHGVFSVYTIQPCTSLVLVKATHIHLLFQCTLDYFTVVSVSIIRWILTRTKGSCVIFCHVNTHGGPVYSVIQRRSMGSQTISERGRKEVSWSAGQAEDSLYNQSVTQHTINYGEGGWDNSVTQRVNFVANNISNTLAKLSTPISLQVQMELLT